MTGEKEDDTKPVARPVYGNGKETILKIIPERLLKDFGNVLMRITQVKRYD